MTRSRTCILTAGYCPSYTSPTAGNSRPRLLRGIHHDFAFHPGVEKAVIGNHRSRLPGFYSEAPARAHHAAIEGVIVGNDVMEDLIVVINGHDLAGLRVYR